VKENNKNIKIEYCFRFSKKKQEIYNIEIDNNNLELVGNEPENIPYWADLEFNKCPNCPLKIVSNPHCLLTLNLVNVINSFDQILSLDLIDLEVKMKERNISQQTTAQKALSSLIGLLIATSGCPHTEFLKPMARFHLPLAGMEETIYRACSMYLLGQYFKKNEESKFEITLEGLILIYKNLETINASVTKRLIAATKAVAVINSLIMLDVYSKAMPIVIESSLEEIRPLFLSYLKDSPWGKKSD